MFSGVASCLLLLLEFLGVAWEDADSCPRDPQSQYYIKLLLEDSFGFGVFDGSIGSGSLHMVRCAGGMFLCGCITMYEVDRKVGLQVGDQPPARNMFIGVYRLRVKALGRR